jgi:hypothetical protein
MKVGRIISGSIAAGLAAAFLGGADWAQSADVASADYIVSGDAITVAGAVLGALFLALAALLIYTGVRPSRDRDLGADGPAARGNPAAPAA